MDIDHIHDKDASVIYKENRFILCNRFIDSKKKINTCLPENVCVHLRWCVPIAWWRVAQKRFLYSLDNGSVMDRSRHLLIHTGDGTGSVWRPHTRTQEPRHCARERSEFPSSRHRERHPVDNHRYKWEQRWKGALPHFTARSMQPFAERAATHATTFGTIDQPSSFAKFVGNPIVFFTESCLLHIHVNERDRLPPHGARCLTAMYPDRNSCTMHSIHLNAGTSSSNDSRATPHAGKGLDGPHLFFFCVCFEFYL